MYKMRLTYICIGVNNEVYVEMYLRSLVCVHNKDNVGMCLFEAPPLDPGLEMHQHIVTSYGQFPNEPPPPYEPKPEPV